MARFKLQNLSEITEGRELLEILPNKFSLWFVYILIAILFSFFIWAWFTTKEVVITFPGIVVPNDKVYNISSLMTGAIKNIDVKNGQYVTKGQTLLTLDVKNANEKLQELNTQNKNLENNIKGLTNLSNSISDDSNYLNSESKYYAQYQSYLAQNSILNSEVNSFNTQKNTVQT